MSWPILDAAKIDSWEFSPLVWQIEGLWTQGSMVNISGPSQTGKTLLCLYMARALLEGGLLFDRFQITAPDVVLYLALEDPTRRLHARLIDTEFPPPKPGRFLLHPCSGLTLSNADGMTYMQDLVEEYKPDVVFLDTYQRATPGVDSSEEARQSEILHDLSNMVRELGFTLVILDHVRKGDSSKKKGALLALDDVKGSQLKVANSDSVLLVQRSGQQLKVQCHCKDSDTGERGFLLDIGGPGETPKFKYAGALEDFASNSKEHGEQNRSRVLEVMKSGEWLSCSAVAKLAKLAQKTTRSHLSALVEAGKVDTVGDKRWKKYCRIGQAPDEHLADTPVTATLSEAYNGQVGVADKNERVTESGGGGCLEEPSTMNPKAFLSASSINPPLGGTSWPIETTED